MKKSLRKSGNIINRPKSGPIISKIVLLVTKFSNFYGKRTFIRMIKFVKYKIIL